MNRRISCFLFDSLSMEAFLRIECGKQVEKYRDDYETIGIIQMRDSSGSGQGKNSENDEKLVA